MKREILNFNYNAIQKDLSIVAWKNGTGSSQNLNFLLSWKFHSFVNTFETSDTHRVIKGVTPSNVFYSRLSVLKVSTLVVVSIFIIQIESMKNSCIL